MGTLQSKNGAFEKVGECLYRYSNGAYYARIKIDGKDIKRSLKTTDRDFAKRALASFRDEQQQREYESKESQRTNPTRREQCGFALTSSRTVTRAETPMPNISRDLPVTARTLTVMVTADLQT
jgi:hypothetical protein